MSCDGILGCSPCRSPLGGSDYGSLGLAARPQFIPYWCRFGLAGGLRFGPGFPLNHFAAAAIDIGARFLVPAEFEQAPRLRLVEQVAKGAEAEVCLVEIGFASLDCLLERGGPDFAAVTPLRYQRIESFDGDVNCLALARFQVLFGELFAICRRSCRGLRLAAVALGCGALEQGK